MSIILSDNSIHKFDSLAFPLKDWIQQLETENLVLKQKIKDLETQNTTYQNLLLNNLNTTQLVANPAPITQRIKFKNATEGCEGQPPVDPVFTDALSKNLIQEFDAVATVPVPTTPIVIKTEKETPVVVAKPHLKRKIVDHDDDKRESDRLALAEHNRNAEEANKRAEAELEEAKKQQAALEEAKKQQAALEEAKKQQAALEEAKKQQAALEEAKKQQAAVAALEEEEEEEAGLEVEDFIDKLTGTKYYKDMNSNDIYEQDEEGECGEKIGTLNRKGIVVFF
jgi:hypothetical protein